MATSTRSARATPATRRTASTGSSTLPRVYLHRLDARVVLAALPIRSVSVLITDPPYRTVNRSGTSGHLRRWFSASLSWRQISGVLALVRSRMRPDGVALVMTNRDGLRPAIEALERAGFIRVRPIVWDKGTPGLGGGLRHQTEHVLVGYLPGSRTLAGVDLVSVPSVGPGTAGRYPTEKIRGEAGDDIAETARHPAGRLWLTGLALSVDNLAVGFALGTYPVSLPVVVVLIGAVSVAFSLVGLELGSRLGSRIGQGGELIGGLILIGVGIAIAGGVL